MVADVLISLLTITVTALADMKANSAMLKSMNAFPTLVSMEPANIKLISTIVAVLLGTLV
jgi:hypothetical protein